MLTRVLARALAPDVRVCGVAPGPVAVEPGQEERRAAGTLVGRIGSLTTSPRPSPTSSARPSSPERPWWWTAAASCGSRPETGSGLSSVYPWVSVAVATAESDSRLLQRVAGGDKTRSRSSTGASRARYSPWPCGSSATTAAQRRRRRKPSLRSGARREATPGARLGLGLALRGRAPRDHRPRPAAARAGRRGSRRRAPRPAPTSRRKAPGSRGASTARSNSSPSVSAWCWSSPTGAVSQTEIASYLDVPLGTVKTRTRTGLARLAGARRGTSVREPPDLNELVGDELSPDELGQLRKVDALLRRVPAPPHDVPASLTAAVAEVPSPPGASAAGAVWRSRSPSPRSSPRPPSGSATGPGAASTSPTPSTWPPRRGAPGAAAVVQVGERDEGSGNVELLVDVSGLPELGPTTTPSGSSRTASGRPLRLLRRRRRRDERQDDGLVRLPRLRRVDHLGSRPG